MINEGATLKEVQDWLGQASAASTEVYSHMLYKSKENMADRVSKALAAKVEKKPKNQKRKGRDQDRAR